VQDDRLSLPTITSLCSHIRENHCHFLLHLYILHFFNSPFPPAAALQLVQQMMSLKSLIISFPQYIQNSFPALPPSICLSLSRCSSHPAQLLTFPSVYAHLFVCSLLLLTIISSSISSQLFSITLLPPSSTASTWKLLFLKMYSLPIAFARSPSPPPRKQKSSFCSSSEDHESRWLMVSPSSLTQSLLL